MSRRLQHEPLKLHTKAGVLASEPSVRILRVADPTVDPVSQPESGALLLRNGVGDRAAADYAAVLRVGRQETAAERLGHPLVVDLPDELAYLQHGDIVRINPHSQRVNVLYRRNSPSNSLLFTERCNSACIMCSQPPRDVDDAYLADEILLTVPLMDPATKELGITGGEPTLDFRAFLRVLNAIRTHLPETAVHVLTNGRLFAYTNAAARLKAVAPKDLMLGVPVYSPSPARHDFVVQAAGAYDQTLRGLLNLARVGVAVEIRCVIHQQTYEELPALAEFIARNLPFAAHVALMGLEPIGHVKMNLDALWIEPETYQSELADAVRTLDRAGIPVSIYNHQLCTLRPELWPFAIRSISDWKNIYYDECENCAATDLCAGFFASSTLRRNARIRPLSPEEVSERRQATA